MRLLFLRLPVRGAGLLLGVDVPDPLRVSRELREMVVTELSAPEAEVMGSVDGSPADPAAPGAARSNMHHTRASQARRVPKASGS